MKTISFKVSKTDLRYISRIVNRAMAMANKHGVDYKAMDCHMDITACHANGCQLDLARLEHADDFNFSHDVFGIRRHINRETGELMDCFVPRYASRRS